MLPLTQLYSCLSLCLVSFLCFAKENWSFQQTVLAASVYCVFFFLNVYYFYIIHSIIRNSSFIAFCAIKLIAEDRAGELQTRAVLNDCIRLHKVCNHKQLKQGVKETILMDFYLSQTIDAVWHRHNCLSARYHLQHILLKTYLVLINNNDKYWTPTHFQLVNHKS